MIPDHADFSIDAGDYRPDGWFVKLMFKEGRGGEVIGRFDDNSPAIFRNSYGKGSAIRIGTAFFQRYLSNPTQNNLDYLKSLLPDKVFAGIRLENPSAMLRLKELDNGEDRILILLDSSKAVEARLYSDVSGVLKSLNGGESIRICAGSTTTIKMAEGEVKLFVLSRKV